MSSQIKIEHFKAEKKKNLLNELSISHLKIL